MVTRTARIDVTVVAVSHAHMVTICDFPCQFPTNKTNGKLTMKVTSCSCKSLPMVFLLRSHHYRVDTTIEYTPQHPTSLLHFMMPMHPQYSPHLPSLPIYSLPQPMLAHLQPHFPFCSGTQPQHICGFHAPPPLARASSCLTTHMVRGLEWQPGLSGLPSLRDTVPIVVSQELLYSIHGLSLVFHYFVYFEIMHPFLLSNTWF